MGTCRASAIVQPSPDELEITDAAIRTYGRFLAVVGRRLITRGCADGGLICEDRTNRARPRIWRILPDGAIAPEARYNFARRDFVSVPLPHGL